MLWGLKNQSIVSPVGKIQMVFLCGWELIYSKQRLCSLVIHLPEVSSLLLKIEDTLAFLYQCVHVGMQICNSSRVHLKC